LITGLALLVWHKKETKGYSDIFVDKERIFHEKAIFRNPTTENVTGDTQRKLDGSLMGQQLSTS
jgi:hypothetical protein